jgi:uncharacterized protein with HEPN domain
MTERSKKYLSDILLAIDLIEVFLADTKDFSHYDNDIKTQSAVERQLGVIGEALSQFKKIEPLIPIQNDKQIISLRNRLVHAYDSLDNSIIWAIVQRHLSPLKAEISGMV